jgi:stage IV sporulation protein FB
MGTAGRPPALRFTLIGFPTRIDPSFLLLVGMMGFGFPLHRLGLWLAVATVSILAHELGHALAARALGATATITLEGMTGLTRPRRAVPFSRREDALVSVAGPAVGLILGAAAFAALVVLRWDPDTTGGFLLVLSIFTTAGWSIFNLLPILPLDGGHLLVSALPGSATQRQLKAARISMVVAGAGGLLAFKAGWSFSALFAALLIGQNLAQIKQLERQGRIGPLADLYAARRYDEVVDKSRDLAADSRAPLADRVTAQQYVVLGLLVGQREDEARAELDGGPEGVDLSAAFRGFVMAVTGDAEAGVALARTSLEREPTSDNAHWCVEALMRTGDRSGAAEVVEAHPGLLDAGRAESLWAAAFSAADYIIAARIADAAVRPHVGGHPDVAYATLAYNGACSWVRAGAHRAAFASLETAIGLGYADFAEMEADDDLAPLRQSPEWSTLRDRLAADAVDHS